MISQSAIASANRRGLGSAVIESMTLLVDDYTTGTHVESTVTKHNGVVNYDSHTAP